MVSLASFSRRHDTIRNGDWVRKIPGIPGLQLKVRGKEYDLYRQALEQLQARWANMSRYQQPTQVERDQRIGALMAEHLLLDWIGMLDDDEKTPLPFDPALAMKLCTDPEFELFRLGVDYASGVVDLTPIKLGAD